VPLDTVLREVEVNLRGGAGTVSFATEDVFLYGARGLQFNPDAIRRLYDETLRLARRYGVDKVGFTHASLASALHLKDVVKYITDANGFGPDDPITPQIGLEAGSPRIVAKYFAGKAYPFGPEKWPEVVEESVKLLNDNYWYPCLTYLVGFPDATPDDYVQTTELLERLRADGFQGWAFPLILVPIGGTLIEGKVGFTALEDLPREAIDAIVVGWRISVDFIRRSSRWIARRIKSGLVRKVAERLAGAMADALENWISNVSRDPGWVRREASRVNVRGLWGLVRNVIAWKLYS